jgi:hypothetical protein
VFSDSLPNAENATAHPFTGIVININVATLGHRDRKDKMICLVLPIGDYIGGELCLYEPGLVLQLKSGDMVIFPSHKYTHFNMDFEGIRASIVLHSDKEGDKWLGDRNSWKKNVHLL